MHRNVIALLHNPWPESFDISGSPLKQVTSRLRKSMFSRANPRDAEYMCSLCEERWGDAEFVEIESATAHDSIQRADIIVILYPDAIGQGFAKVERDIARLKHAKAEVRVLNGRRREFPLSAATLRSLRLRRFLERTMLGESLFTALFLLITPVLLLVDLATGRR